LAIFGKQSQSIKITLSGYQTAIPAILYDPVGHCQNGQQNKNKNKNTGGPLGPPFLCVKGI
jgi:hypothetical protein